MGYGICCTQGPKGGGDLKTGTAGISVDSCSSSSPMEMWGFIGRTAVTCIVLGEGLPIPGIDLFEDFPLLTLAVAKLELANSLQVPLGGLKILPFVTMAAWTQYCVSFSSCQFRIVLMNRGMESTGQFNLCLVQQNLTFMA